MEPVNRSGAELTEHTFQAGAVTLNYAESLGDGPPILLIHGLGRRWQVFLPVIAPWLGRWPIYAIDLRGHGASSHVSRGYRGTQFCEDVVIFLREVVKRPAVIFGHSLGGMIGMWVAAHHPDLVRALILGDNMITSQDFAGTMYPGLFGEVRDLAKRGGSIDEIIRGLGDIRLQLPGVDEPIRIGDLPGQDENYLRQWAECVKPLDPDTFAMALDGSAQEDWEGEALLANIRCPTLLLQANPQLGGLMSDADVQLALQKIGGSQHVKFLTLGHSLHIQRTAPVLTEVTKFIESLRDQH